MIRRMRRTSEKKKKSKPTTPFENAKMRIAVMKGDMEHIEERIARAAEECTCGITKKRFHSIWRKYFDPPSPLVKCPSCGDIYSRYSGFMHKCPTSKKKEAEGSRTLGDTAEVSE